MEKKITEKGKRVHPQNTRKKDSPLNGKQAEVEDEIVEIWSGSAGSCVVGCFL